MACAAHAEGADDLKFLANIGVIHDSNLFRLSRDADTQALIGRSSAAETITTTTLGVRYDKSYSLQRVRLTADFNQYDYQNFQYLGFNGLNYRAGWDWAYTPHLRGTVSTSRNQTLNSFVDYRGFNQRNERVDRNTHLDAAYALDARWRLTGGLSHTARSNELPIVQEADFRNTALSLGAVYALASGSTLSYTLRSTDGDYLNRPLPSPAFADNAYEQIDHDVQANWAISRATSAVLRAGHRSRTHPNYPQRDFKGFTGGATVNWAFSSKSALSAGWAREIGPYETTNSNFQRVDRFSIGPTWQLGAKTTLRARLEHAIRNYDGSPSLLTPSPRRETTTDASISVDWQPYRFLSVNASLQNARRSANIQGLDFKANILSLTAQFSY